MGMRITYVARSFLDYRIPVLDELNKICQGQLYFISSDKWAPQRALDRLKTVLGERAIYLKGEKSIGVDAPNEANTTICLPYQPGLLKTIADTRPQVVIGDGFFQWSYAVLFHRIFHGIPLVVCYERWSHTERNAQWYRRLYRKLALHFTDAVCCDGKLCCDYTRSLGILSDRLTTGNMAADTYDLQTAADTVTDAERDEMRTGWRVQGLLFLYVGRLIRIKGIAQLLKAWARFEQEQKERATLVLVGGGPEESSLRAVANDLNLQGVRFVGQFDYSQIHRCYAAADAFIIPTLEDNWSLVVPEAMACGLPILCSKYNGCWPELVQIGINGWVFDPFDPKDVVRCLHACMQKSQIQYGCVGERAGRDRYDLTGVVMKKAMMTELQMMGEQSREILKDHSPAKAANAIYRACQIALTRSVKENRTICVKWDGH